MFNRSAFNSHIFYKTISSLGRALIKFSDKYNPHPVRYYFDLKSPDISVTRHVKRDSNNFKGTIEDIIENDELHAIKPKQKDDLIIELWKRFRSETSYYVEDLENGVFEIYNDTTSNKEAEWSLNELALSQHIMSRLSVEEYRGIILQLKENGDRNERH
jgi:hypothetical protein